MWPKSKTHPTSIDINVLSNTVSPQEQRTTPSSDNSPGNTIALLQPSHQSTANKILPSKSHFRRYAEAILNDTRKIPEILQVFADLDFFIDSELSELNTEKRVREKLDGSEAVDVFKQLKEEYCRDMLQHQKNYESQLKQQRKSEAQFSPIEEEEESEDSSILNLSVVSQMNRSREKKIGKLEAEAVKQEYVLSKVNRLLENITRVDERNIEYVVKIERHYLVASSRFQSALTYLQRLKNPNEELHPRPFNRKGELIVSEVMLEVKPSYFERRKDIGSSNEYIVVLLKYNDKVYATNAVRIADGIRIVRFPQTIRIPEAYLDFEIRLEVYGTKSWCQQDLIRKTMLRKYGFTTFTLAQTGSKRQRFEMIEVIKSVSNPLRKKILVKIRQKITVDVHHSGVLFVKIADSWVKTNAILAGHLLQISLADNSSSDPSDNMLLDLYNFDSEFAVPVLKRTAFRQFAFMLKFNHHIDGNDFQ